MNYEDIMGEQWRAVISKAFQNAVNEEAEKMIMHDFAIGELLNGKPNFDCGFDPGGQDYTSVYIHSARQGGHQRTYETIAQMEADSKKMNLLSIASKLGQIERQNPGILKRLLTPEQGKKFMTILEAK